MKNYLYRFYSGFDIFLSMFYRALLLVAIFYLILMYEENPFVISITTFICTTLFLIIGTETYYVAEDKLIIKSDSIVSILNKNSKFYVINEIKKIELQKHSKSISESLIYTIGKNLFNQKRYRDFEKIFITYKDNRIEELECKLDIADIEKIIDFITRKISQPKT